jgi:hypothetical protein
VGDGLPFDPKVPSGTTLASHSAASSMMDWNQTKGCAGLCTSRGQWQTPPCPGTDGWMPAVGPSAGVGDATVASTDLDVHDRGYLDDVAIALNDGPRQTLGWMKPCE